MNENLFQKLLKDYPELLSPRHLIQIGLYPSIDSVYLARARGKCPDFIRFKRKVLYPKTSVIEFLEKHFNNTTKETKNVHKELAHKEPEVVKPKDKREVSLDFLLSVRASNPLARAGITVVKHLLLLDDDYLLNLPKFGRKSLREVKHVLKQLGFVDIPLLYELL